MSSSRLFHCARCHRQVVICSCCDRGNIYCEESCSQEARRASLKAAGKRYQGTFFGKMKHAKRQSRYRKRINKVTHQGSPLPPNHDLLPSTEQKPKELSQNNASYCHFCGCKCDSLVRIDFLRTSASGFWPRGP